MIEYIHGDLTELTPAMAVVETAGVGYQESRKDLIDPRLAKLKQFKSEQQEVLDNGCTAEKSIKTQKRQENYKEELIEEGVFCYLYFSKYSN